MPPRTEIHAFPRLALALLLTAALLLSSARTVGGQAAPTTGDGLRGGIPPLSPLVSAVRPLSRSRVTFDAVACAGATLPTDPVLAVVSRALRAQDRQASLALLSDMEPAAREEAFRAPDDVSSQHRLAALLGARAVLEGGRAKITAAREVHRQVDRILVLDPEHPGAHHVLGRLHAGVMRLDRVTRFLATRVLGGGALSAASWDAARTHLERAERAEPCRPEHHLELARLYGERGEEAEALAEVRHVLVLTEAARAEWGVLRAEAGAILEDLGVVAEEEQEVERSLSLPAPRSTTNSKGGEPLAHPAQRR